MKKVNQIKEIMEIEETLAEIKRLQGKLVGDFEKQLQDGGHEAEAKTTGKTIEWINQNPEV
jgi:hypothetical protein